MKIAIQQPYFFPYLNYFCLINQVDKFVIFDNVQYVRHAWFERNRILKPCNDGWQWFMVPLMKHSHVDPLASIRVDNNVDWQQKIMAQLNHYKKKAPYFNDVTDFLSCLFKNKCDGLTELNVQCLKAVCDYLKIDTSIECLSCMGLNYDSAEEPGEWALNICRVIKGADKYYNLPGGVSFFDRSKYIDAGIDLRFLQMERSEYNQRRKVFEPDLSILDVMMFNSPDAISQMLNNYTQL